MGNENKNVFSCSAVLLLNNDKAGYRFTSSDGRYFDLGLDDVRKLKSEMTGNTVVYQTEPEVIVQFLSNKLETKNLNPCGGLLLLTSDEVKAKEDGLWKVTRLGRVIIYKISKGLTEKEKTLLKEIAKKVANHIKTNGLSGYGMDTYYPIEIKIKDNEKCAEFGVRCHNDYDEYASNMYIAEPAEDILNGLFDGEVNIGVVAGDKHWFYISVYRGDKWGKYCKCN